MSVRKAAYSDLVRVDAATIGLLHETGTGSAYETVEFRRVPLSAVTGPGERPVDHVREAAGVRG